MSIVYLCAAAICTIWIIRRLSVTGKINLHMGTLALKLQSKQITDVDGISQSLLRIYIRGSLGLPERSTLAVATIRIMDVTDAGRPLPVRSLLPNYCDDNEMFYTVVHFDIPNGSFQLGSVDLVHFILNGLHAPYQGARTFDVRVRFSDGVGSVVYTEAHETLQFMEERLGYVELDQLYEQARTTAQRLADLMTVINGTTDISEIDACLDTLLAIDLNGLRESVYEQCVVAVATLSHYTQTHRVLLEHIAQRLELPIDLVTQFNDRHLRMSKMEMATDEDATGLPSDLSVEQQLEYLAAEYRKWRARAMHADPAIAAEATARMDAIARARAALTEQKS